MKLLTQKIINALPELGKTDLASIYDKIVICKFFSPTSNWTWYVLEGEKQEDGDYLFYGIVHGFEKENGYFLLSELVNYRGHFGLGIERDRSVFKIPYRHCL